MIRPFVVATGLVAPLPRRDVDTDQIIPKQFLKRIGRSGFGECLFHEWRTEPDFVLNLHRYRGASILVAGANFGCGSSREHAAWALADYGFRAVVAPSFADIFVANCTNNGLAAVTAPPEWVDEITRRALCTSSYRLTIDLERLELRDEEGLRASFDMDPFRRHRLMHGLDEIALTMEHEGAIAAYEREESGLSY